MKNILKASHLFYCCFLSGISLLLLTGCETQESIVSNAKPTGTEFTGQVQPITMQQLRGIPGAFARLKEVQPKLNHGVALAKTEEEYFNAVDTTQVVLIEVNGKQTVTMRIIPDDASDKTENLVLQTSNDGLSFNAYVFEYNPDAAQKALISQGVPIEIIPKSIKYLSAPANTTVNETYSVPADGDGAECVTIYSKTVDYCKDSSGKEIVVTGSLSDNCANGYHSVTYFIMNVDMGCLGGGGDGSGSDGGSTGGTGGSTGGGSGGTGGGTGTGSGGNPPGNNGPGTPQAPQNYIGGVPTIPIFIANTIGAQLYNHFTASQLSWWDTTATADEKAAFIDYAGQHMKDTGIDADALAFVQWSINYLMNNPDITLEQFKNWFMGESEGQDGTFDAAYWNNPNLIFPAQALPSYDDFFLAFPSHYDALYDTPQKMYTAVGGQPLAIYNSSGNENTCALRVSKALNYSGITIPNITGKTFKGADNKYYFLGAANLMEWMKKTFGSPTTHLTGSQGGQNGENFPSLLQGKKGIYFMIPNNTGNSGFGASGHADLLDNQISCDGKCYFNATGGVKDIFVWELN